MSCPDNTSPLTIEDWSIGRAFEPVGDVADAAAGAERLDLGHVVDPHPEAFTGAEVRR